MRYYYQTSIEEYLVNETGEISRPAIRMPASGQWRIMGAVRFNNFGHRAEYVPFPDCFTRNLQWRHKNGKPRFFLHDCDHGTFRIQMSPAVLRAGTCA